MESAIVIWAMVYVRSIKAHSDPVLAAEEATAVVTGLREALPEIIEKHGATTNVAIHATAAFDIEPGDVWWSARGK